MGAKHFAVLHVHMYVLECGSLPTSFGANCIEAKGLINLKGRGSLKGG